MRAAAIRGNVHERNRLAGLSEVYKTDVRRSPARVRITRLPVQFRETGFFPPIPSSTVLCFLSLCELVELSEEGEWRNKVRPVASLFLSHRMPLSTVAVAFAAYFDFLRGLESGWNQDVASCRLCEGESAVSIALISILFLNNAREHVDCAKFSFCNFVK